MPGTSLGIFWIDMMLKPILKGLLKSPELALLAVLAVYGCIAYRCLKSAYMDS